VLAPKDPFTPHVLNSDRNSTQNVPWDLLQKCIIQIVCIGYWYLTANSYEKQNQLWSSICFRIMLFVALLKLLSWYVTLSSFSERKRCVQLCKDLCRMSTMVHYYNYCVSDIIHHPVSYLQHTVLETGYCPCLQVKRTQLVQLIELVPIFRILEAENVFKGKNLRNSDPFKEKFPQKK
jgi:hypothetical protein